MKIYKLDPSASLGMTKKELGMTKKELGMTKKELGMTKKELGMTKKELGMTKKELGMTKKSVIVAKKEIKNGFSIIEVIIAVFVIVVGLVAMMNLMANSLRHTIDSRDHIIASSLAQEGVELVRNVRDNSWLDGNPTDPFDDFKSGTDRDNCRIDYNDLPPPTCNSNPGGKKLYYDSNFYVHNGVNETKFQRKLVFKYYDIDEVEQPATTNADKAVIQSIVIWSRADNDFPVPASCTTANKCVYAEDVLTNWH